MSHLVQADVGSICRRIDVHHVFDSRIRIAVERFAAQITEYDAFVVHHHAQVVGDLELTDALTQMAGCELAARDGTDTRLAGEFAFAG